MTRTTPMPDGRKLHEVRPDGTELWYDGTGSLVQVRTPDGRTTWLEQSGGTTVTHSIGGNND